MVGSGPRTGVGTVGFGQGTSGRRGTILAPCSFSIGVRAGQGIRERDSAVALGQVPVVQRFHLAQVFLKRRDQAVGQDGHAVLSTFAVADGDGAVVEIQVFDPQAHAFHQAETRAIQQSGHQLAHTRHLSRESLHLVASQDGGEASGFLGAQGINRSQVLVERLAVEKEKGGKSLIMGRGGDPLVSCQVGEKRFDFGDAHVPGVAFVVEEDEAFDPVDVGLFSADGGVFDAQRIPDLVQQFPGFWFHFIR